MRRRSGRKLDDKPGPKGRKLDDTAPADTGEISPIIGVRFWAQERWYRRRVLCPTVPIGANLWAPDSIFPVE